MVILLALFVGTFFLIISCEIALVFELFNYLCPAFVLSAREGLVFEYSSKKIDSIEKSRMLLLSLFENVFLNVYSLGLIHPAFTELHVG